MILSGFSVFSFVDTFMHHYYLKFIFYFQSRPQSSWVEKYQARGKALSLTQIRNFGRQVLEVKVRLLQRAVLCLFAEAGSQVLLLYMLTFNL